MVSGFDMLRPSPFFSLMIFNASVVVLFRNLSEDSLRLLKEDNIGLPN
jgi:hypothetical protein